MASILVVEDERLTAEETAAVVRGAGHHVVGISSTGESALDLAERTRPDLALVDIGLAGGMDGIAVAERLYQGWGVGIVYVTAQNDPSVLDRAKHTTPYGYVLKPFDERTLETSVEIALARQRAEKALRDHGIWLSTLLKSIGIAVIATDEAGRIRFANPLANSLTGRELSASMITETLSFVAPRGDGVFDPVSKALQAGHPVEFPVGTAIRHRDGRRIAIEGSAAVVRDPAGHIHGAVIAFRDVSEKLEIERERHRTERLEALGTLSAGIAHDFNNMLVIIMNSAALAQKLGHVSPRLTELMNDIEVCADRARGLTSQLTAFAKGGNWSPRKHRLEPLLRHTVGMALRGSSTHCNYEIGTDVWPVSVDENQISQVFTNLILNAREAMTDSGVVLVSARNRAVRAGEEQGLEPGDYVEISVADRGPGISEQNLERVFDPYFTTKANGSGLGLSSAYGIVRRHGGTLRVESRPGKGTIFVALLPASDEVDSSLRIPPTVVVGDSGGRVLLMDDEAELRKVLSLCLEELGYHVETAHDGEQAIALYRSGLQANKRFDLVILDLVVKDGMGGEQALEQLKQLDPSVCAIASSGYTESDVLSNYQSSGFYGALPKPYSFTTLALVLRDALGSTSAGGKRA